MKVDIFITVLLLGLAADLANSKSLTISWGKKKGGWGGWSGGGGGGKGWSPKGWGGWSGGGGGGEEKGWGWGGQQSQGGGGWGHEKGWGWLPPKVVETHEHIYKVKEQDVHEHKTLKHQHHEKKVIENTVHKEPVLADDLHKLQDHPGPTLDEVTYEKLSLLLDRMLEPIVHKYLNNEQKGLNLPVVQLEGGYSPGDIIDQGYSAPLASVGGWTPKPSEVAEAADLGGVGGYARRRSDDTKVPEVNLSELMEYLRGETAPLS